MLDSDLSFHLVWGEIVSDHTDDRWVVVRYVTAVASLHALVNYYCAQDQMLEWLYE